MSTFPWTRIGGAVAALAGVALLFYAPFHAAAYMATPDGSTDASGTAIAWAGAFRGAFPDAFSFAAPQEVYLTYGRILPPILAGFALGVAALHARQKGSLSTAHRRWSYWALQVGTIGAALGVSVEYYTPYLEQAFLATAPFLLLCLVGYVAYGIGTIRAKVAPRIPSWLLTVGAPAILPLIALLGHIPIAHSVIAAGWIGMGSWLARN